MAKLVRESVAQYVTTATQDADREEKRRRALEFLDYIEKHPEEFRDIETVFTFDERFREQGFNVIP